MTQLADLRGSRELLVNLVLRDLRGRYKRSALGWGWSLLNPLATVAVYSIVFSFFLKIDPPRGHPSGLHSFVAFLLCGLLAWNFFSNSMSAATEALLSNANLIKKVYFPRELLVVSAVGALLVSFLIELGVLCVVLLALGNFVLPWIPMLLVVVAIEAVFVLGISLMLSVLNVYFRDVKHFVAIALQALFYSAPIVYPQRLVPQHATVLGVRLPLHDIYVLNPLVRLIACFRSVLYDLTFPAWSDLGYIALWAVAMLLLGYWVFGRLDRRLAEEV